MTVNYDSRWNLVEVRHGYTLDDIDRIARLAVARAHCQAMDYLDRYEAAWDAVAVALCADEAPAHQDLWVTAAKAVDQTVRSHNQTRGYDFDTGNRRPAFERYWEVSRSLPPPEDQVVDQLALRQIWPELTHTHREVLTAMATYGEHTMAAVAVDRTYRTFNSHLKNARRQFFELWHEGEQPSRFWGKGDRRTKDQTAVQMLRKRTQVRARRSAARRAAS